MSRPLGEPVTDWRGATVPSRERVAGRYGSLEPLRADHAGPLWEAIAGHPELWTYIPDGPFAEEAAFREWAVGKSQDPEANFFAICSPDGMPVGVASYLRIAPVAGSIEIGFVIYSPVLQRTRLATEAMFLAMRRAFSHGFRRYEWKCDALNAPSRAAALRLGFTYEGTFRNALVVKGRNRDTAWFSVTDDEWPGLETAFEAWLDPNNFAPSGQQRQNLASFRSP